MTYLSEVGHDILQGPPKTGTQTDGRVELGLLKTVQLDWVSVSLFPEGERSCFLKPEKKRHQHSQKASSEHRANGPPLPTF